MKTKTERTPTPWIVDDCHIHPDNGRLAYMPGIEPETDVIVQVDTCCHENGLLNETDKANLHFIVRACNCHEDLLEACKIALPLLEKLFEVSQAIDGVVDSRLNLESDICDVRDAIDKAEPA